MQPLQVVDPLAAGATALCPAVVAASHVSSLARLRALLMSDHRSLSRVTAQVLGEALSLQCSSCSRRSGALEQRDGPYGRAAWGSEV